MLLFWLGGRHREVISAAIRVSQKPAVNLARVVERQTQRRRDEYEMVKASVVEVRLELKVKCQIVPRNA